MNAATSRSRPSLPPPPKNSAQSFTTAGYYVYSVKPRGFTGKRKKAKLEAVHHLQRTVPHPRPRRPAHPRLARDARQAAEKPQLRRPAAERLPTGAHRRIDLRQPLRRRVDSLSSTPPPCSPASAPATSKRCSAAFCRSSASRSASARSCRPRSSTRRC